jgi:hypothetical protein
MRVPRSLTDNIDDPAVALPLHDRQHGFCHHEKPKYLAAKLVLQNVRRAVLDSGADVRTGVVDENIDAAEGFVGSGDEFRNGGLVSHIGGQADHAAEF